ncbi:MAG: hypothetical protein ACFFCQ_03155, partial [Promethearchaeota archaeon]
SVTCGEHSAYNYLIIFYKSKFKSINQKIQIHFISFLGFQITEETNSLREFTGNLVDNVKKSQIPLL